MLDERLTLAFQLITPCDLAADIGTDHAHLPAELLRSGTCRRMILTDCSASALANARQTIIRLRLTDRADLRLGNGLEPIREKCDWICITGMGGRSSRDILLVGQARLQGAALVLSAHTDLPLVRAAVSEIGYTLDREEPCYCAGRFYLVLRARPGAQPLTDREIRLGGPLFRSASPMLLPWLQRRRDILRASLEGLRTAVVPDRAQILQTESDLAFYNDFLESHRPSGYPVQKGVKE